MKKRGGVGESRRERERGGTWEKKKRNGKKDMQSK